jgi:poly(3-hydroxybutyrate) depolymerase
MDTKKKISVAVCRASGAAFLAFILSSCGDEGPVDPIQNPGDFNRAMRSGGLDRVYDVHVPATVNPSQPSPLVIMLHGVPRLSGMAVRLHRRLPAGLSDPGLERRLRALLQRGD